MENAEDDLEARDGIEPSMKVLQTYALPLGYRAPKTPKTMEAEPNV